MSEFLAMGGYAAWVWSAYGLTLVVLVGNVLVAGQRYDRIIARLRTRLARARGGAR